MNVTRSDFSLGVSPNSRITLKNSTVSSSTVGAQRVNLVYQIDIANNQRSNLPIYRRGGLLQLVKCCHRRVAQEIKKVVIREDGTILPEITNLSHAFAIGAIEDGPLCTLVNRYFEDGYHKFDRLCRSVYAEVLPAWDSEFVPWDQIVAERSHTWRDQPFVEIAAAGCRTCGSLRDQQCGDAGAACIV